MDRIVVDEFHEILDSASRGRLLALQELWADCGEATALWGLTGTPPLSDFASYSRPSFFQPDKSFPCAVVQRCFHGQRFALLGSFFWFFRSPHNEAIKSVARQTRRGFLGLLLLSAVGNGMVSWVAE